MKLFLIAAICILCSSCTFLEDSCSLGNTRSDALYGKQGILFQEGLDTLVYVSAVDMPPGVDWQKDIAMGLGPGKLLFYKNHRIESEQQIGYAYGVSADADTHHIIDGHLYTEFSQVDRTIIKKDGEPLLEYPARECLSGLIENDGSVHTLGVDRDSGALSYRIDGKIIFSYQDAYPFGSFQEISYPETGALSVSDGKVCFSYALKMDNTVFYRIVRDGVDNQIVLGDDHFYYGVQDIRLAAGNLYVVSGLEASRGFAFGTAGSARLYGGDYNWSSLRISVLEEKPEVFGSIKDGNASLGYGLVSANGTVRTLNCREAVNFGHGIYDISHEDCIRLSNRTVAQLGSSLYEALTPRDMNRPPFLVCGRDTVKYKINGYLTGVSAGFSQTSSASLFRPERR